MFGGRGGAVVKKEAFPFPLEFNHVNMTVESVCHLGGICQVAWS